MAGFEIVVRPVVFPNIRPAPAQSQAPASDPTKGICTIKGSSGKHIDLPFSWSISTSTSRPKETKRRVDVVRVYQKDDNLGTRNPSPSRLSTSPSRLSTTSDSTVNKDNYVDIQVANRIWMNDSGKVIRHSYTRAQENDNIEIRERDKMIRNPG